MEKINYKALFIASFVAVITFLIVEFVIENIAARPYGITDTDFMTNATGPYVQIINLLIFLIIMILIMSVHVAIRPSFTSDMKAALMTAGLFLALTLLFLANFSNAGRIPWKISLISFSFNLLELPPAIIFGALSYSARTIKEKNP